MIYVPKIKEAGIPVYRPLPDWSAPADLDRSADLDSSGGLGSADGLGTGDGRVQTSADSA